MKMPEWLIDLQDKAFREALTRIDGKTHGTKAFIHLKEQDYKKLLSALKIAMEALEYAAESIHSEFCGGRHHHPCCDKPSEALAKIKDGKIE